MNSSEVTKTDAWMHGLVTCSTSAFPVFHAGCLEDPELVRLLNAGGIDSDGDDDEASEGDDDEDDGGGGGGKREGADEKKKGAN